MAVVKVLTETVQVEAVQGLTLSLSVHEADTLYEFLRDHSVPVYPHTGAERETRMLSDIMNNLAVAHRDKIAIKR